MAKKSYGRWPRPKFVYVIQKKVENKSKQDTSNKKEEREAAASESSNVQDKNKPVFFDTSKWYHNPKWTILISIFALLVSFFSLGIDYSQNNLIGQQIKIQKNEDQPIFIVKYEKNDVYTEFLHIQNFGNAAKSIKIRNYVIFTIKIIDFTDLERVQKERKYWNYLNLEGLGEKFNIPVFGYFVDSINPKSVSGEIAESFIQNNYWQWLEILNRLPDCIDETKLFYYLDKYLIIEYRDIHDEFHSLCYLNGSPFSLEEFRELKDNTFAPYTINMLPTTFSYDEIDLVVRTAQLSHQKKIAD